MKKTTYNLYKIDWIDACSNSSWVSIDLMNEPEHHHVSSIGWLVKENKDYYVLAQNLSSNGNCADRIQIPKKWIRKVKRITGNIIEYK